MIEPLGGGWYLVTDGDRRWRVAVATDGDTRWVFCDGVVAEVDAPASPAARKRRRAGADHGVMAPMPATVVAIKVAPGDTVTAGQVVMVLEAMKMELPLKAPTDGTVKVIACAKGDLVQPGVSLLEIA